MSSPLGLVGIAARAGRLAVGYDPVRRAIACGEARLILVAQDLSPRTRARLPRLDLPVREIPYPAEVIGRSLGRGKPAGVLAVLDPGLAAALMKTMDGDPS